MPLNRYISNVIYRDYPSNWWRDHGSMQRWLQDFLPSKVSRLGNDFYDRVVSDSEPWLVDFYAPWCGHCVQFAPVFEHIAGVSYRSVSCLWPWPWPWPWMCTGIGRACAFGESELWRMAGSVSFGRCECISNVEVVQWQWKKCARPAYSIAELGDHRSDGRGGVGQIKETGQGRVLIPMTGICMMIWCVLWLFLFLSCPSFFYFSWGQLWFSFLVCIRSSA